MKRLKKIIEWLINVEQKRYQYTVYIADDIGAMTPVMLYAANQYEANLAAQEFEKGGVHVISVERVF